MRIENLYVGTIDDIVDNICDIMDYGDYEKEVLDAIKKYNFSNEQFNRFMSAAARERYMEVLNYCFDTISFSKDNVCGVLAELIYPYECSSKNIENVIKTIEKVDSSYIDLTYESSLTDLTILDVICLRDDNFEEILSALYRKAESCFTDEIFDKIITIIHESYEDIEHLAMLSELLCNEYFSKLSDESKEKLISEIFHFIRLKSGHFYTDCLNSKTYKLFVEYLKSKDLCIEYFEIAEQISLDDMWIIEENIEKYSEVTLINFFNKTKFVFEDGLFEENFLYALSSLGYTKLIDKLKENISFTWLNDMLYFSLERKHLKTASYLLKTFGINNFEITKDIIGVIKRNNLSKVLFILLKNKNNHTNIDWKEWFKDVNEFYDIIETYCHDIIFSIMPYEYQILLMELMEGRKGYVDEQLNDKCRKFKEFAVEYGYDF